MNALPSAASLWPWVVGFATMTGCARDANDTGDSSLPGPQPTGCDRPNAYDEDAMTADLAYLASPELDGRAPGSAGDELARAFVAERFACLGLLEVGTGDGFQQPFTDDNGEETANVLGMIPGAQPSVMGESVVISAHLDHFGDGWLGANDNASGVAALLAIAQSLVNEGQQPDRTIVFAALGAEESGFEGSERFMRRAPTELDLDQIVYNVNMDMVGSFASSATLYALGTFRGTAGREAVSAFVDEHPTLDVSLGDGSDQSDNYSFCAVGIPYVFFWTEDEPCYHERCDRSERIDYPALTEIAALSGETALELANRDDDLLGAVRAGRNVCFL
ncbi:MAG: hypothetical protein RIT28_2620 [Pseudomonadota bacterium]